VGRPYSYHGKTLRVAVFRDISVLKEAEEKTQAAVDQLNATLSALPDLFFEVNREGVIFDYRAANPQLLYRPPEDFLGKDINTILPPRAVTAIRKAIEEAAREGRSSGITYSLDIGDETFWFELSIASRGNPKDPDNRFIALVRDITERKRSEEILKKTTRELRTERKILTEKNIALNQVLEHLESQRQSHKQQVLKDIEQAMRPFMNKLRDMFGEERANKYEELEAYFNAILGKDLKTFTDRFSRLTSRESQICELIKDGLSSKQISEELNLSVLTVQKHREQIRKKLGITHKNVNLATYLRSH
jgi:PAS domain S-box-containing protein